GNKPGIVVVEVPAKSQWCTIRQRVFAWTPTRFPLHVRIGENVEARSSSSYHRHWQGILGRRPCSKRSEQPEKVSAGLRCVGNSSGDEINSSVTEGSASRSPTATSAQNHQVSRLGFARAPEAGRPNPVGGPPWDLLFLRALVYRRSLACTRLGNVRLGPDPLPSLRRVP